MEATEYLLWFCAYIAIGVVVALVSFLADILDSSDDAGMVSMVVFLWPTVVCGGFLWCIGKAVMWIGERIKYL